MADASLQDTDVVDVDSSDGSSSDLTPTVTVSQNGQDTSPIETLNVSALHQALADRGYLCERHVVSSVFSALHTNPIGGAFLFGPPGAGKTWLAELLAEILGCEDRVFFKQATPGMQEEELLVDMVPDDSTKLGVRNVHGELVLATKASLEGPTFLILDEWDKTKPSADAFLLDWLQNGRVNHKGVRMTGDPSNLIVFVTLNNERDISGPLIRRLPHLHFQSPPPEVVKQALVDSHGQHPYVEPATDLYIRCELSSMEKPATIQELRQLLDAATLLGEDADWNQLVLDYVTKDHANHDALARVGKSDVKRFKKERDKTVKKLDPSSFGAVDLGDDDETDHTPGMPSMADVKGYTQRSGGTDNPSTERLAEAFAAISASEYTYSELVKQMEPTADPNVFGYAKVEGETITFDAPISLHEAHDVLEDLWGYGGEVVLSAPEATIDDLIELSEYGYEEDQFKLDITSRTDTEAIGRLVCEQKNISIRVTEGHDDADDGAEIILPISEKQAFDNAFMGTWITEMSMKEVKGLGLPTKVLARLGRTEAGILSCRNQGIEIARPFYAGIFDLWGVNEHDKMAQGDIPGFDDFLSYASENAEEIQYDDSAFFLFDGIMFGFVGEDTDQFIISITGPFDDALCEHVRRWVPGGKILLQRAFRQGASTTDLVQNYGFEMNRKHRFLIGTINKVRVTVRNEKVAVGSYLTGKKINAKMIGYVIKQIQKAEKAEWVESIDHTKLTYNAKQ